jgi:hypothetical protein
MTKDEALDLALEALEYALPVLDSAWYNQSQAFKAQVAITAIKQARALDKKAENARELGLDYEPVPVQEPVAWGNFKEDGTLVGLSQHPEDQKNWTNRKPLYITPPAAQRQWVGLTDEERNKIRFDYLDYDERARAIEAKLKEKNT